MWCTVYRVYYITERQHVSEEAFGVLIWCVCVLSCSWAEADNNRASVLFPVVTPPSPHSHTCTRTTSSSATCWLAAGDIMADSRKTGSLEGMTSLFITHETERERRDAKRRSRADVLIFYTPMSVQLIYNQRPGGGARSQGITTKVHSHKHKHTWTVLGMSARWKRGGVHVCCVFVIISHSTYTCVRSQSGWKYILQQYYFPILLTKNPSTATLWLLGFQYIRINSCWSEFSGQVLLNNCRGWRRRRRGSIKMK